MDKQDKIIKLAHWNITNLCNYSCSYCDSKSGEEYEGKFSTEAILKGIEKNLKGRWRIRFDGSGEPFLAPDFLKIVEKLVKMGHEIGVFTNFSAPLKTFLKFCQITKGSLFEFNTSLHLESTAPENFLKKVILVREKTGTTPSVFSVACEGKVENLEKIRHLFIKENIPFIVIPKRVYQKRNYKKKVFYADYSKKEIEIIKKMRKNAFDIEKRNFKGKLCWAGSKYLVIGEGDNVWRCLPAKRNKAGRGYLGRITDKKFKLNNQPLPCCYEDCYCKAALSSNVVI